MNFTLIGMIIVVAICIHLLLKEFASGKKGNKVNTLVIILSVLGLIAAILYIIITIGGINI